MSELEKTAYDRGFYNGIHEARQIFAKHLNVSTSTDEIKWDNVSKTEILSEIDDFMMKNQSYYQPQFTIPKSIADELDENYNNNHSLAWFDSPLSQNILNWYDENHNNWNIANIYINSKALGVDLVKVGEG